MIFQKAHEPKNLHKTKKLNVNVNNTKYLLESISYLKNFPLQHSDHTIVLIAEHIKITLVKKNKKNKTLSIYIDSDSVKYAWL